MYSLPLEHYTIYVGSCQAYLADFLNRSVYSRVFILVDEHTEKDCLPIIKGMVELAAATPIQILSGEQHKNLNTCGDIWKALMDAGADRNALLINLGGGVIGDMGGFCASTYKRGIDFIQIPTTLLSQVDSSIGGKLGIDFHQVKNSIGVFANPQAVFIDTGFLSTLSSRERRSGFAEMIKHALIADSAQWDSLKQLEVLETVPEEAFVVASLTIKKEVVEADPFEKGLRKALNFGHTIGHALESVSLETPFPLLHGEAIAAGMICESFLSYRKGFLSNTELDEICTHIVRWYKPREIHIADFPAYFALMRNDKKNEGTEINFSLIGPPGCTHINQNLEESEIMESFHFFNAQLCAYPPI